MNDTGLQPADATDITQARDWVRILARYRDPIPDRAAFELAVTIIPFVLLVGLTLSVLQASPWIAGAISLVNAAFLVRLFMIQHDCGHGSFFKSRALNDWTGRVIGVLTLTPYDVWRRNHAIHHSATGNLDRRGIGDIPTLTVKEYREKGWLGRLGYRLVRNPLVLFGLVPIYVFYIEYRVPRGLMQPKFWLSAVATDAALAALLGVALWFFGVNAFLFVLLPTTVPAAAIGMWLFYVQHQFEHTSWNDEEDWDVHNAALHGSSYYKLPTWLRWITADIGVHHVHHLASRIPFYRFQEVLRDHDALEHVPQQLTLRESLHCASLHLWDEEGRRLVSFGEAKQLQA